MRRLVCGILLGWLLSGMIPYAEGTGIWDTDILHELRAMNEKLDRIIVLMGGH